MVKSEMPVKGKKKNVVLFDTWVEKALEKNNGSITKAAKSMGVSYRDLHTYMSKNPSLWELKYTIDNTIVDAAEEQLMALIDNKNFAAIKMVLLTKGKDRGWTYMNPKGTESGKIDLNISVI
jgi:hypothetical protein